MNTAPVIALLACVVAVASGARQPNIVWIMSDDLGYGEVEVFPASPPEGRQRIPTPHLNQFAREGIQFTQAYTGAPVCAPSRCTLFTSKHLGHAYIRNNHNIQCPDGPGKVSDLALPPNETTTANVLRDAGYHTVAVGKWGLGSSVCNNETAGPLAHGFNEYYGQQDQRVCHLMYAPAIFDGLHQVKVAGNESPSRETCMAPDTKCQWTQDLFVNRTLQVIEERANHKETPFFLYVAFTTPHAGGWKHDFATGSYPETGAPVPSDGIFTNQSWPTVERDHASQISTFQDVYVGQIMASLRRNGLDEDTIVFFASDNGAHNEGGHNYKFFDSTGPLRGFKRSLYEGGIRTPSLVRWPGTITPAVSNYAWAFWDVMPTFAELAGVSPSQLPSDIDGESIVPTLFGQSQAPKPFFYWEFCYNGWGHAVRIGDWKAVSLKYNEPYELYNLATDESETNNVAADHPDIIAQATAIFKREHVDSDLFPMGPNCKKPTNQKND